MEKIINYCLLGSIVLVLLGVSYSPVYAISDNGLTVSPAYVDVNILDTQLSKDLEFVYTNHSQTTVTLQMLPIDFKQTDPLGTIGFVQAGVGSYSYSLASFLSFSTDSIIIPPGEHQTVAVKVTNRPDLSPGGHYAAVVAKLVPSTTDTSAIGGETTVAPSISSLIFLRKTGGERYNLSLKEVSGFASWNFGYPDALRLEFQNEGNVHLVPYGTAEIRDMFGRLLYKGVLNNSSSIILPESRRIIYTNLDKITWSWPLSVNTLTIRGKDSLDKTVYIYNDSGFYIDPWAIGVIVLFVVILIGYLVKKKRK